MLRMLTEPVAEPPTLASLERERARQQANLRLLRPLGGLIVVLVMATGVTNTPHPGMQGRGLGVLLALLAFAAGLGTVIKGRRWRSWQQAPLFVLLVGSSAALASLQPDGPGILGCYVAVSAAAMRLSGRIGLVVAVAALVALAAAASIAWDRSFVGLVLSGTGVIAFYVVSRLAQRLRIGQEHAIRLLAELEESHRAEAQAAALAERQRLARDMHDVLAHSLSGLVLQLEGARLLAAESQAAPELAAAVDRALHLGKAGLEEARRAIGALRDEELPGPERLPALVQDFERDARVRCSLDISGDERRLSSLTRLTLFRVAQEALTNVRRHAASADSVSLRLAYEPDGTRLVVEDVSADGTRPCRIAARSEGGYGITGMRERAELLGGRLDAGPTDHGFRVELWVPA